MLKNLFFEEFYVIVQKGEFGRNDSIKFSHLDERKFMVSAYDVHSSVQRRKQFADSVNEPKDLSQMRFRRNINLILRYFLKNVRY